MPQPNNTPLSLSDILCPICREILLEPVTLPCNHTLCNPCFQMTVEKSSLCCPFCRRRVSTWARYHARNKTLVNSELWERIQREYPKECQHRANGQDSEDLEEAYTVYPVPQLSKPGELREEYEAEVKKLKAEQQVQEEEERRASEEYILRLLAEEAEEHKRVEKQQRDLKEQLRNDEKLARLLSAKMNVVSEVSEVSTPAGQQLVSRKAATSTSRSCKSSKNRPSYPGGIQRYLSPVIHSCSSPLQLSENKKEDQESPAPVERSFMQHTDLTWAEEQDEMPTLSPQMPSHIPTASLEDSILDRLMPQLSACSEKAFFPIEQDATITSNNGKPEIDNKLCMPAKRGPSNRKTSRCISFPCSTEKMANIFSQAKCQQQVHCTNSHTCPWVVVPSSADGSQEKNSIGHNLEGMTRNGTEGINVFDWATNWTPKRKCEKHYLKEDNSSSATKRRRACMVVIEGKEEKTEIVLETSLQAQPLTSLESDLCEKQRQEEQDRLLALKLQKEMDKEMSQVYRQKGSPDEYCLRAKPSSSRDGNPEEESTAKRASQKVKTNQKSLSSQPKEMNWEMSGYSSNENSCPSRNSFLKSPHGVKREQETKRNCNRRSDSSGAVKALQASNKQQTILDMFQKRTVTQ
ncbi:E3 ubiquitin-protein ligase RNF168 [Rhinatrema bivittatum]|uniref:E3 ubiquitin-protein ligase RNF168 n=1 Tax=Rhinatrema bivittatum TaxID=194408 RepID=UPI00112806E1|nr:E3 ubiquitin-protein ligase RNF168 [Rhinatrema bivittatum]